MVFERIGALFARPPALWQEADVRHFVQQYLRRRLKTDALYCEGVRRGVITVRVASPALAQAVRLVAYDVGEELKRVANLESVELKVWGG